MPKMQNEFNLESNDCVVSEANSRGSDVNVFMSRTEDIPSMPSMPTTTVATHHPNQSGVGAHHNLSAQQLQQLLNSASNNCHKNNTNINININTSNNSLNNTCSSPKLNLMAELFESEEEDDENSEIESFTLEEDPVVDTSKFLLSAETSDNKLVSGIHLTEAPEIDPESRANLEALLDADKHLIDPDVLRRIASSFAVSDVHCALDEAAAAIAKMRINDSQLTCTPLSTANAIHKSDPSEELTANIESSSRLLEDRCGVNEVTEDGESFLSFACSSGHYELAKQLLVARANVEDRGLKDTTPLMEASSAGHLRIVELLIENNAEVNAQTSQGNTPLMYACAGGHEEVVKLLLKNGANVEDHNENGHTPLMEAASAGHVGVAAILVEHGASINTHSNEFKESALTLACYKGHLEMVRFLLEAGADQEHKTDEMHTALMEASMDGHVEVARLLLDSGAQVNMPADSFESPLTLAACGGHVELAMLLLERGANIEEVNDEGYTPLMEAAREGHEEMVALLLSQGADINAQTEETQETALTLACCGGFLDVADFLIKAGADIEAGANTPLMEAAQEGHLDLVRHLINSGASVNATTSSGDTALMYASENGHTDVAELLLQTGANLEHEAEGGRTSLMKACRAGHLCTVQFLINRGANVNKMTANNDHTPLSLACAGGHLAVVELLLANSADPTHRLKDSATMLIEAAKGGHTTVVQLLIDYPTNLMASSPPITSTDADPTPRVPPHGLQVDNTSNRSHSSISSSIQSKVIQKTISKKNISKENNLTTNSTNVMTNKTSDTVDSYVPFSKGRTNNKVLERSLSDSGTSFMAPTNIGLSESTTFSSIDALKEAERLEARINDMIRRTDELDPAKEEQIRQKQQILEELQRVEREYQAHWQQQLIQCYQAGLSCGPSLSQMSANIPIESTGILPNVSSQGIPLCLEVSSNLQKPLKTETSFQMPSPITQSNIFQPTSTSVSTELSSINSSVIPTQTTTFANTMTASTNTPISLSTPPASRRLRSNSKIKSMSSKQHSHQTTVNNPKTTTCHSNTSEEVEKMNLKNTISFEHLDQNNANSSGVNQQTQSLLQQQQMILSELAQNFSSRPETLQFLQAAASNMKIDASIPFLLPRLFEANALSQTSVIQSQNQSTPQSVPQTTQSNTSSTHSLTSSHENVKKSLTTLSKTTKANKTAKAVNAMTTTQIQPLLQTSVAPTQSPQLPTTGSQFMNNQTTQTSLLQTLTSDQLLLLKTQFAASTATQTDGPSALQPFPSATTTAPTVISQTPNFGSTTSTGIYSMGAPAFPVSLTLSPVTISPSMTTTSNNRSTIISTIIPYPVDVEESNTQTDSTSSAPQLPNVLTTTGIDISNIGSPSSLSSILTNTLSPSPNFDSSALSNVSTVLTASLSQSVNTGLSSLASHMSYPLPNPLESLSNANDSDLIMTSNNVSLPTPTHTTSTTPPTNIRIPSPPPWYPPVDVDSQTDSNHDTALTLACAGGHEELVSLLLNRGAEMEHRDKKGFTPLMLSATAGHSNVVEIMLNNGSDMEAQSERTKDTALSLACSSGRYEVVEILLSRGANKEHRNVSDYTPLSLAASGGYVNIIKLLLSHGAEINSRTGSKLGISPLMLAAMNGHSATVRLLLDMGSDINAQIETNRNTALTLACFQGRCEVVGLLLDRKANVEHRAKTGLTPLMEAASGGYVEVGRVLLDKGADVNAPPVPSSRDTALTIAADKGHYRFVELLLTRGAAVDVKNKKGNSPLWLACNGGHLDVIQLLVNAGCDIDSQDNRKVSCLMSAFRKGHVKAVKWMVKHVNQFPSDQEINRFIALINDKELLKKSNQCSEILRQAKERQAAEANKNATILLEEIDLEHKREENRKAAAARRRERKRQKKKEKQELIKSTKTSTSDEKENKKVLIKANNSVNRLAEEDDEDNEDDEEEDEDSNDDEEEDERLEPNPVRESSAQPKDTKPKAIQSTKVTADEKLRPTVRELEKQKKVSNGSNLTNHLNANQTKKSLNAMNAKMRKKDESLAIDVDLSHDKTAIKSNNSNINANIVSNSHRSVHKSGADRLHNTTNRCSTDIFSELSVETSKDFNGNSSSSATIRSPNHFTPTAAKSAVTSSSNHSIQTSQPKKGPKREEGWKEVIRKSKKVVVPSNAISRVIGRGGCNINTIREISGAHIEVEKQKGQGDRMVVIKGSADATRHAHQLIAALSKETEKDLSEIIKSLGLSRPTSVSSDEFIPTRNPCKSHSTALIGLSPRQPTIASNVLKSSSMSSVCNSGLPSNFSSYTNRSNLLVRTSAPVAQSSPFGKAWNTRSSSSTRIMPSISSSSTTNPHSMPNTTKSTVSYTMAVAAKGKNTKTTSVSTIVPVIPKVIASSELKAPTATMTSQLRPTGAPQGLQPFTHMYSGARVPVPMNTSTGAKNTSYLPTTKQPFNNIQTTTTTQSVNTTTTLSPSSESGVKTPSSANGTTPEYTPFNNLFSKVAQQSVWGQSKDNKPNFASVAASGLTSIASSNVSHTNSLSASSVPIQQNTTKEQSIDMSKAPGYRGNLHISPSNTSLASTPSSCSGTSSLGPIGSGHARSAPCTPPLVPTQGPLTPSNTMKMTTPPLSGTPTPPPQHSLLHHNRSVTDPQNAVFSMTCESKASTMSGSHSPSHAISTAPIASSSSVVTSYQPSIQTNVINSSNLQPIVSTPIKSQTYGMSSTMNVSQRHSFVTNTTYSPNNSLTNVGAVSAVGSHQTGSEQNQSVFGVNTNNAVQSNLNPNAPDFSARVSVMQSSQPMNGPSITAQNRMASNSAPNVVPNPTIVLQDQMRAAILAASANLQLQTLQRQQAERLQMVANSGLHHNHNHLAANDFGANTPPPSPETLRLLHTAINSIPTPNSTHGLQHYGLMPAQNYMSQPIQHQRLSQTSINSMNIQKEMESNVDYEERKLPRPIGTERAQHRKNPTPVFSHNINPMTGMNASNDTTGMTGMWPFGCEVMASDMNEWQMQAQQQMANQSMHSNMTSDNPMSNMNQNQFNSEDISHFDSTAYSMNVGSHVANALNYSPSGLPVMGMNGVPPHVSTALYQSMSSNNTVPDSDYWNAKMAPLSAVNANLGNGMSGNQSLNSEQKMNWNHWNNHQT